MATTWQAIASPRPTASTPSLVLAFRWFLRRHAKGFRQRFSHLRDRRGGGRRCLQSARIVRRTRRPRSRRRRAGKSGAAKIARRISLSNGPVRIRNRHRDHFLANAGAFPGDRLVTRYTVTAYSPVLAYEGARAAAQLIQAAGHGAASPPPRAKRAGARSLDLSREMRRIAVARCPEHRDREFLALK